MEKTKKINDKTMVTVYNNSDSSVGYTIQQGAGSIVRKWYATGTKKEIELSELKAVMDEPGGRELFITYDKDLRKYVDSFLLIKDNQIRNLLDFPELNEYVLDTDGIKNLFNSDDRKFEDTLSNCSTTILELIVKIAIEENLQDMRKLQLITDYVGYDVIEIIKNNNKEKEEIKTTDTKTNKIENNTGRPKKNS